MSLPHAPLSAGRENPQKGETHRQLHADTRLSCVSATRFTLTAGGRNQKGETHRQLHTDTHQSCVSVTCFTLCRQGKKQKGETQTPTYRHTSILCLGDMLHCMPARRARKVRYTDAYTHEKEIIILRCQPWRLHHGDIDTRRACFSRSHSGGDSVAIGIYSPSSPTSIFPSSRP